VTALIVIVAVAAAITWGVIASRRTSARKKEAIADLQVQQDQIAPFDIHALVAAEVADLGLRSIKGSTGIPASVLLKTWKEGVEIVNECPSRDLLSFVVTAGVDPSEALDSDISLVCEADANAEAAVQTDEQTAADGTPEPSDESESE
jgi:hypothetical protein